MKWQDRIEAALKSGKFTEDDRGLIQLWTTDPISEIKNIIELKDGDVKRGPKDIYLILDGIFLTKAVEDNDMPLALNCYRSMNQRAIRLHGDIGICSSAVEMCNTLEKKSSRLK